MKVMWNSSKHAAMAIAGVGLAVAAATPASAWCPGYYGAASGLYAGCGPVGYYGSAYGYGSSGYGGVFTYGWPYATSFGISDYGGYGAAYGYGGYGGGYGAAYGYGGGWVPYYTAAGWGCGHTAHRSRGASYAVASNRLHSPRFADAGHLAVKPAQSRIAYRANLKLARAG
jgi:hypothetical protein